MMLPKYIWLIFCITALYMLYSSTYYSIIEIYVKDIFNLFYKVNSEELLKNDKGEILFTPSALKKYNNLNNGLYLSILGQVFDVTNGAKHYGPGESYHAFTGRDGSAAFITGDFTENGITDDVSSLTNKQIQSLIGWVEFYRKTYEYKGKLIGRYYNKDGSPTNKKHELEEQVKIAEKHDSNEKQRKIQFPPCNVEWDIKIGSRVWCSKNSGGITRNWVGVPRILYDSTDSKQYRCACVKLESNEYEENKDLINQYDECAENAISCIVKTIKA